MEKIRVSEIGIKFKDLPKETPSKLRYNLKERSIILEVEGFEPLLICCDKCGGPRFVQEGALSRCIDCDNRCMIGFKMVVDTKEKS